MIRQPRNHHATTTQPRTSQPRTSQPPPKMQFSRYLYERTEIEASFINTLLKGQRKQATFWITELFLSGWREETIDLLWQVYYDFYYIYYSNLERKLQRLFTDTPTLKSILTATITLLSLTQPTIHVFELRLIINKCSLSNVNYIYKKIPHEYDIYKNNRFVISIMREHIINIAYYFQEAKHRGKLEDLDYDIKKLLKLSKITIRHKNKKHNEHLLIAMMSKHMVLRKKASIKITKVVLSPIKSSILEMFEREDSIEHKNPYYVLSTHRKYEIDDDVGLDHFSLTRFNTSQTDETTQLENQVKLNMYFHWEYFAFNTPVWRERFESYKAFQNHETKDVEFPSDEIADHFYQKYAYDPDEQSTETDEKSTKNIEEISYKDWLSRVVQ